MGKSAPSAPDPVATANAQSASNRETAITQHQLNMVNQYNPWGSVEYTQNGMDFTPGSKGKGSSGQYYLYNPTTGEYKAYDGGMGGGNMGVVSGDSPLTDMGFTGKNSTPTDIPDGWEAVYGNMTPSYSQTTTLSPEQQAIFDQTQGAQTNLATLANEQSGKLQNYLNTNFEFNNDDAAQWAYDLASPRILQQQGQNETQLRNILANKGIREGHPAWESEMARLTNANTDQINQLALSGRSQAFSEALAQRNQPINEITALLSGSQVSNPAQMSSATPQTAIANTDVAGIYNNAYQNQLGAYQSQMGGIGGLFGSVLGAAGQAGGFGALFSDRRLKKNIHRIGVTPAGTSVYSYQYVWGGPVQIGVMAQEVPHAARLHDSGFLMVDYSEVK